MSLSSNSRTIGQAERDAPVTDATICFSDTENDDEATVIVRTLENFVGLTLSLRKDGDIEVFLRTQELDQLIDVLSKARGALRVRQ